ncbi:DinB family protein [Aureispira anguillae]|uniref:DinB family protein n=1 Tax=Aureispira anguillae TaxID=2864201 RepID=A0A915YJ61_9BACT|nr:DinB family protein [Aureispira anguillae]BDS14159.1 DinB family protein [Aureispira anguillae]
MNFPKREEYNNFFATYINHLPAANPLELLEKTQEYSLAILQNIPQELWNYRYEEGKWTVKELVMHLIDCEQILAYRALRFARGDFESALSFDEDAYAQATNLEAVSPSYLIKSTELLRQFTLHRFSGFTTAEQLQGGSEAFPTSVRAVAAIIAGHQLHHIYVLQERYLKQTVQKFEL